MTEPDRRSFIAGAIATLFVGITPAVQPIEVKVHIVIQGRPPLWNEICNEMLRGYVQAFGDLPDAKWMDFIYTLTDSVYVQFIALEAAYDSLMTKTMPIEGA